MPKYVVATQTVSTVNGDQPNGNRPVLKPETDPKVAARRSKIRVAIASMIACVGSVSVGFNAGFASPALPNLNRNPNPFHMNREEISWFISIGFITAIVGALLTAIVIDIAGRKLGLMMAAIPIVTGWIIISGASSKYMMYGGRLLSGMSGALLISVVSVYIAEIAPPHVRGILMSLHEVFANLGILVIYVAGSVIPWNWLAIVCVFPPVILTCCMLPMPESPRWLVMKGRLEEATEALQWLRGGNVPVAEDIDRIQQNIKTVSKVPWCDYFRPPLLKPLIVSQVLFAVQEFSGINVVRTYTVAIFQAAGSHLNAYTQTIIVGAMMLAGSVTCTLIVDRLPRRLLLVVSTLMMAVSMAAMGTFFIIQLKHREFANSYLSWLPLAALVGLVFSYTVGLGPLCYIITNELFSTTARGRACSLGVATLCLTGFLTTKFFVNIRVIIGDYGTFWACGVVCLFGALFGFFFVPETKGKSLEETHA